MARTILGMTGKRGSAKTGYVQAQAGKDTAAERMTSHHGFVRIALADGVRDSLYALNPLVDLDAGKNLDTLPKGQMTMRLAELVNLLGWEVAKHHSDVRALMQRMGTEAGRQIHGDDLWTELVEHKMRALGAHTPVVITDVRFPNEAEWVRYLGGRVVEVYRPEELKNDLGQNAKHASENMGWITPDETLLNDGTIEELHARVDLLLDKMDRDK